VPPSIKRHRSDYKPPVSLSQAREQKSLSISRHRHSLFVGHPADIMESGGASPFPESRTTTPSSVTPKRTKICVYCGSSPGNKPEHLEAARALARAMAANNIALGEFRIAPLA
jgi:hypothetical protein